MKPTLRFAESDEDRERVYRFRYQIYVEEMGRTQFYADAARRRIEEPLDATGHLLVAEWNGAVVGTLRTNFARSSDLSFYIDLLDMRCVGEEFPEHTSLTTKFMILPMLRSGTLAVRMGMFMYGFGREHGIRHDFIDCNAHLEDYFMRQGYRKYHPYVVHPEYGRVLPLRMDLEDFAHLRAIGSPFVRSPMFPSEQRGTKPTPDSLAA